VRRALAEGAEYVIRNADRVLHRRGAVPPLQAHEIEPLAQELGAPLLMIQPVHGQVALLFIRPSGEIEMHFSPFSLGELRHVLGTVHSQFHIRSGARGAGGNADAASRSDDAGDALGKLWEALIGPICHRVAQGEPLTIVPYREFALVPFALLPDPEGRPLVEHHALSIAPSLATLRTLRRRGPWSRPIPTRAYVAGDPTLAPKYRSRMGRLLVARAEAEAVATTLRTAGVSEENVLLRLTKAAHEESYRREARGCDLVHLSCHAKMDQPAHASCLFFAPHGPYDGLLLASEVADVRLDDALVFLAACETGQGRATADGVIGLGRAFLEAGARAVVLSLWGVEDAATAALSDHFYRALLSPQTPLSSAAALRAAMLATRTDLEAGRIRLGTGKPLKPRPAHWAPFTILGDGLAVRYRSR
jgi:CHAT domain-containing protein